METQGQGYECRLAILVFLLLPVFFYAQREGDAHPMFSLH